MSVDRRVQFYYRDATVRATCETVASLIRERGKELLSGIVYVGEQLFRVKEILDHGQWGDWLQFQFNMSTSTAENYMNAYKAVTKYPELWVGYDPTVLYLFTRTLSDSAARAIVDRGPVSVDEARVLIQEANGKDWYREVAEVVKEDPGMAYQRITQAMKDDNLSDYAEKLLHDNASLFAHHAGRDEWEVKKEAGVTALNRIAPRNGNKTVPQSLFLHEGDVTTIRLWVDGSEQEDIVILPRASAPGQAWQRSILHVLMNSQPLGIRSADDLVEL